MQLMILDAETTIDIQSKMSEINEETLDEKFVKSITENFSNDLSETKGDDVTNINLSGDDKDKEILENKISEDETSNKLSNNLSLTVTQTLPIENNSSNDENKKPSEIIDNNSLEKKNTVVKEDNENRFVVIKNIKTDESNETDLSSEILLLNENSNTEAKKQPKSDDESNNLDDDITQLDINLSKLSESTNDDTNSNTEKSKDIDNIITEEIENKNKCIIEAELDSKLDRDTNLKNVEEQNKNCIDKIENNNQEDSKLNDEFDISVRGNDETENSSSDKENYSMKDEQDNIVKDTKDICTIKEDSLTKNIKDSSTKDEEDSSLTESRVDSPTKDKNDSFTNKEEDFRKDKESSLTKDKNDSPKADKENNFTRNREDVLAKNEVDILTKDREDRLIKDKEDSLSKHKEGSLKKDEKDGTTKDQEDSITKGKEDDLTKDIQDSLTKNEEDSLTKNTENSLTKDEDIFSKSSADINCQTNNVSNHSEMGEKEVMKERIDDKNDSITRKSFCTENRTVEHQDNIGNENKIDRNEIPVKKSKKSIASKLSNTLDILSDDEDKEEVFQNNENANSNDGSVSLVDDDDIMLIEDVDEKEESNIHMSEPNIEVTHISNIQNLTSLGVDINGTEMKHEAVLKEHCEKKDLNCTQKVTSKTAVVKPLLPANFLKTSKKNLADMTREDLEEFCILKIVESVIDRSSLGDVKAQLKTMAHTVEEYKKKFMVVARQSRDLQLVLKSIQEEQKKPSVYPITPLKITRSVGMQVFMTDQPVGKKRQQILTPTNNSPIDKSIRSNTNAKPQKNNQQIPVPRLVPAATPINKASSTTQTTVNNIAKSPQTNNSLVNGIKNSPPSQKPEKRARVQSVTVDLTDDEPPPKIATKSSPAPPVRLIQPQNLLPPQRQPFVPNINSPRKVYIPIGGPQSQNIRPGHTILLKSVPSNPGLRQRGPMNSLAKMQSNQIRMNRVQSARHPAPLPEALKQYQPSNWKALPPAPDLKLSKVDNGIVVSWKMEGHEEDSYEEITSYQLYAYQETPGPPSIALWKKIGDVKALPLPMACTLTQFMAGYKYYFAVRAIDVKSRLGPFSIPGSIILLNKT